jgi:hypothetical protein
MRYEGSPSIRIWPVGSHRLLGVEEDCSDPAKGECPMVPDGLGALIADSDKIYGDFLVCPLTGARTGWMQFVCVEQASHLVVRRRDSKAAAYERVNGTIR